MSGASYRGLKPASDRASRAARGASKKSDTKPEVMLRKDLWRRGLRYRKNVARLPGKPDIVFTRAKVAVFVDGDFWHGRDWETRREKLSRGHNAAYWIRKIDRNLERDRAQEAQLRASGWVVLRAWESDIRRDVSEMSARIAEVVVERARPSRP